MKENIQTQLAGEIYHWISSMKCAHVGRNPNHICFCANSRKGTISFYEEDIMELAVEDKETKETLFYIHFAIRDVQETKENVRIFFQFLKGREAGKAQPDLPSLGQIRPLKLLVSCSCGITSTYFALFMQEALDRALSQIRVSAVSYTQVEEVQEAYDYILLAPQIGYLLPEFQKKYGNKVMAIDMVDFASHNVGQVLNAIIKMAGMAA